MLCGNLRSFERRTIAVTHRCWRCAQRSPWHRVQHWRSFAPYGVAARTAQPCSNHSYRTSARSHRGTRCGRRFRVRVLVGQGPHELHRALPGTPHTLPTAVTVNAPCSTCRPTAFMYWGCQSPRTSFVCRLAVPHQGVQQTAPTQGRQCKPNLFDTSALPCTLSRTAATPLPPRYPTWPHKDTHAIPTRHPRAPNLSNRPSRHTALPCSSGHHVTSQSPRTKAQDPSRI